MSSGTKDGPGPIPPRWLHCPRKASQLIGDKFLPFKTPLSTKYDDQVPEEYRFPPKMLLNSMKSYKVKIGLWIDLTFTSRFYDKQEVEEEECRYLKLQCRGHKETPTEETTKTFIKVCHQFISQHPLEAIELPTWHKEYDDSLDDEGLPVEDPSETASSEVGGQKRRRKGNNRKKPAQFMEGVTRGISVVTSPEKLHAVQDKITTLCRLCGNAPDGFAGCQPVSMDTKNLSLLREKPYMVSWKADGTRYMMLINGENQVYLVDRDNNVFQVDGLRFPHRKDLKRHLQATLVDGEMVIDKENGQDVPKYLIYDIIHFEGMDVGNTRFSVRLICIDKEIIFPRRESMKIGLIDRETEPFGVKMKQFWDVVQAGKLLSPKFAEQLLHEPDGLIFQPSDMPYKPGQCMEVLKWKPLSHNSVDFLLKIVTESGEGILPRKVGHLYVGGRDFPIDTIKVTKALKDLNGKIVECKYQDKQWVFMRERTDKSFPNSYKTAQAVWNSIVDPVTSERLLEFIEHHRYTKEPELMPPPAKVPRR
ncbi:hypothetical protein J437_LFUL006150 [Ladona fulva]|uniref:mRNA-capping enzyme n=1 Tax=Ladona fulva TaxID=123851 RepID=A0A8K0NXA6_LADFU|nr:hypothetical protein J437_LFUL006150 [Ladona fulva]